MKQLNLYTDASLGNNLTHKVAGIGIVLENPQTEEREVYSTYLENCDDINLAEMYAIYTGLKIIVDRNIQANKVRLLSDNKICVGLLTGSTKLFREGEVYSKEQRRKKMEMKKWLYAIQCYAKDQYIKISHINGHKAFFTRYNCNNAMADVLSRDGVRKYYEMIGVKDERYKRNESYKNKFGGQVKGPNNERD